MWTEGDGSCLVFFLLLGCALLTCWSFAQQPQKQRLYGDAAPPIPPRPPVPNDAYITGLNLSEALFDAELQLGRDIQGGVDGTGPLVLPVTGSNDIDDTMQARLQKQEQYEPPEPPEVKRVPVKKIAQAVMDASVKAADPAPPKIQPLDDLLPARVWQPVWSGCAPFFVESRCENFKVEPRLYVDDTSELQYARSLAQGQVNLIEPIGLRQSYMQFLTMDCRSKKDNYSRASMTNDVAYSKCQQLQKATPEFVVW
jgi:hypothetical protein